MKNKTNIYLLVVFFLISACANKPQEEDLCRFENGSCIKRFDSKELILEIRPLPPQAFKELTFILSMKGGKLQEEEILLDLTMPGMFMGQNQVKLKRNEEGRYIGKGVIPRCPSGKTLWQATVIMPSGERADFRFHVR